MGIVSGERELVADIPTVHQSVQEWDQRVDRPGGGVVGGCLARSFGRLLNQTQGIRGDIARRSF
jgi:hypothetical protein